MFMCIQYFPIWHLNRADISVIKNNFLLKNVSVHSYHLPPITAKEKKIEKKINWVEKEVWAIDSKIICWSIPETQPICRCSTKPSPQLPWIVSDFYSPISATCVWVGYTVNKKQLWGRTRSGGKLRREKPRLPHQLPWIKRFIKRVHWNWHGGTWAAEMKTPKCIFSRWWLDGGSAVLCRAPPLLGGVGFRA